MRNARRYLLAACLAACLAPGVRGQEPVILYPPGPYTVTTPAATTIERGSGYVTLRWGASPGPIPTPTPVPVPTPDVVPVVTGHAWAVVIYDKASPLTDAQAALVASMIPVATRDHDITLSAEPSDSPIGRGWINSKKLTTPLPALIVVQDATTILHQAPMPDDAPSFATLFGKLRGKVTVHATAPAAGKGLLDLLRSTAEAD